MLAENLCSATELKFANTRSDNWIIHGVVHSKGITTHFVNGIAKESFAAVYQTTNLELRLAADHLPPNGPIDMDVAEIVAFNRAVSEQERVNLETYFTFTYGL